MYRLHVIIGIVFRITILQLKKPIYNKYTINIVLLLLDIYNTSHKKKQSIKLVYTVAMTML